VCQLLLSLIAVFSSFKIGNMFGVKNPIPGGLRSRMVCKFALSGCNASYAGETVRHFSTRMKEHLVSNRASQIFKHLQNSEHCRALCSADCFHVLDHASTSFQLKHGERLYITRLRCSDCQSQIPTDDQCSHLIGLFTNLILARCHKILESDGGNFLFYFRSKGVVRNQLLGEGGPLNFGGGLRFFGCLFAGGGQNFSGLAFWGGSKFLGAFH